MIRVMRKHSREDSAESSKTTNNADAYITAVPRPSESSETMNHLARAEITSRAGRRRTSARAPFFQRRVHGPATLRKGGMNKDQGKGWRGWLRTFSTPNPHTHPHWSAVLWIPHVATIEIPRNRQNVIARDGAHCMLARSFRGGVETVTREFHSRQMRKRMMQVRMNVPGST